MTTYAQVADLDFDYQPECGDHHYPAHYLAVLACGCSDYWCQTCRWNYLDSIYAYTGAVICWQCRKCHETGMTPAESFVKVRPI
jgi:hypothetical protein